MPSSISSFEAVPAFTLSRARTVTIFSGTRRDALGSSVVVVVAPVTTILVGTLVVAPVTVVAIAPAEGT